MILGSVMSRPTKVNSLYPGSYYQPGQQQEPRSEALISRRQMPQVDRFFESFDDFGGEDAAQEEYEELEEEEEPSGRELPEPEPEPESSGRELKELKEEPESAHETFAQPEVSLFEPVQPSSGRELPEPKRQKFSYHDEEAAASDFGYFKGYSPRSIVLTDDTAFEARFPFPAFPK